MATYHLSTKPISRSSGRSATASSAYRTGTEIKDERTGLTHDYTKRSGVVETRLHLPKDFLNRKLEGINRQELWNLAEKTETRKNSRTAREIVINLPHELSQEQRSELTNEFANSLADKYEIAVDVAIHAPDKEGDNRNHHAHLMLTTRNLERMENGSLALTDKSQLEMSNTQLKERNLPKAQDELKAIRKEWADMANQHLEKASISERIDHRSHANRGLDVKPTIKMGWKATEMERKGIKTDKGDINRAIRADNEIIRGLKTEIIIKSRQIVTEQRKAEKAIQATQAPPKAEKQPIKSRSERKSELKASVNAFDNELLAHMKKLQRGAIKSRDNEIISKTGKLQADIKQIATQEPQKPVNPFKHKTWGEQHEAWRKSKESKLNEYNALKKEYEEPQATKEHKIHLSTFRQDAVNLMSHDKIDEYNENGRQIDSIQYEENAEKRQERSQDRGMER